MAKGMPHTAVPQSQLDAPYRCPAEPARFGCHAGSSAYAPQVGQALAGEAASSVDKARRKMKGRKERWKRGTGKEQRRERQASLSHAWSNNGQWLLRLKAS